MIQVGQHVAGEQIEFGRVRVPGEDERIDSGPAVLFEFGQNLVGIPDDGGAAAGPSAADAGP
jgi:hypothetical protein